MTNTAVCPECSAPVTSMVLETYTVKMDGGEQTESWRWSPTPAVTN